jgi:drug/metabolite transporter (DMT)-like permease
MSGQVSGQGTAALGVVAQVKHAARPRGDWRAVAAFVAAGVLWGVGFPFGKVAFAQLGAGHVVLYRFVIATLVLMPLAAASQIRAGTKSRFWPRRRDLPLFLVTGVLSITVTFLLQFAGLQHTTAASAALVMGAATPLLALAAVLFGGEHLHLGGWLAVAASTLGVILIVGGPSAHVWLGDALVALSAVSTAAGILLSKRLLERYPPTMATAWMIAIGTLALVPASLAWDGPPKLHLSAAVWGSVLVLGLGSSALSYLLYNWGLEHFDASRASIYLNLEPLVGALLGVFMLGESLASPALIGGALIVGAAVYVSRG